MKKFWKQLKPWFFMMWRPVLIFIAVALVVGSIFGFRIGNLTNGAAPAETQYIASVKSGRDLLNHPVYAVHKVPVYILFKLHAKRTGAYRAVSGILACLAVISCFFIIREWYTLRVAIIGSWLFLSSAWVLHIGRLATPEASLFLLMPLMWAAVWLYNTTLRKTALVLLCGLIGTSFYIPGFGWLLIVVAVWQRKVILKELRAVPLWLRLACGFGILLILAPLIRAGIKDPHELLLAGGLPDKLPHIKALGRNLIHIPQYLFLRGPHDPMRWLARLPLLDVFSSVMLVLGVYSARYSLKLIRQKLIIGVSVVFSLLIMLGGPVTITVLMPLVAILIAGGIAFLLQQWFSVFPSNPIARTIGTTLVSLCVLLASFYHVNHYFIAWPQTPETKTAFGQSLTR